MQRDGTEHRFVRLNTPDVVVEGPEGPGVSFTPTVPQIGDVEVRPSDVRPMRELVHGRCRKQSVDRGTSKETEVQDP